MENTTQSNDIVLSTLLLLLNEEHDLKLNEGKDLNLRFSDIGLDSLTEAEFYLNMSDALELKEVTSAPAGSTLKEVIEHFREQI